LASVILRPLPVTYLQSWESGKVAADWKLANVIPVFKKGKKDDPGHYRPVSLTPVRGKMMEVILGVTEKDLKDNAVISQSQHGFLKEKLCLTNLITFHDKVTHLVYKGKGADVGFFWILAKLLISSVTASSWTTPSIQLRMPTIHWVNNWLTGRAQRLAENGVTSSWWPVTRSVPQC